MQVKVSFAKFRTQAPGQDLPLATGRFQASHLTLQTQTIWPA
jgi:hypothetical protein